MLVIALFFVATAVLLPFTQGEAIQAPILYPLYLFSCAFLFYAWFWTHGGQTLGLRAWKIRIISDESQTDISWKQAFIRYITAICTLLSLGLGLVWRFWQKDSKTWQDLSSKSSLVFTDDYVAKK
ncbi:MAG: RDD family protein [Methyloprofundus sp.]|nr:RDD family protein [Methyloprofundus sp.]